MKHPGRTSFVVAALCVLGATSAPAQVTTTVPTVYRLEKSTTYQHGCFAPCACPIYQASPVRGTFSLIPRGSDPLFENFDVTEVKWKVPQGATGIRITGSGTYRIGGEFARQHQLSLDLRVGDDPVQHFDSGLVVGGSEFPRIRITISIHGGYCLDTVFEVHARPLMRLRVGAGDVSWESLSWATGYDVVAGELGALRAAGGDFSHAAAACLVDEGGGTSVPFGGTPAPGSGFWLLGRENEGSARGSYDPDDAAQVGTSDPGITASSAACP